MTVQIDHVTTDPACRFHVPASTWWGRRRQEKARALPCLACAASRASKPTYDIGRDNLIAIKEELALLRAMDVVRARLEATRDTGDSAYTVGYRRALAHVLSDLGRSSNGSMTPTFRISSPSEREQ